MFSRDSKGEGDNAVMWSACVGHSMLKLQGSKVDEK